jgi:DNA-damage-inducible protein J
MGENSVVRARIDERTKREAAAVLKAIGLTVSDAFRLLLVRVAAEKALPFEPLVPNADTVEAMNAARRGELVEVGKPEKLLGSLNAGG